MLMSAAEFGMLACQMRIWNYLSQGLQNSPALPELQKVFPRK